MPVVLLAVAALILCGVVAVALGRGGELVEFASDRPPFDPDLATAADVAMLRPPSALWGYSVQATDQAFNRIAQAVTERDVEIAALRRKLEELTSTPAADQAARTKQLPAAGQFPAPGRAEELRPAASSHLGRGPRSAWELPLEPEPAAGQGFQPSPDHPEAGDDK